MKKYITVVGFMVAEIANKFNISEERAEELLEECDPHGIWRERILEEIENELMK